MQGSNDVAAMLAESQKLIDETQRLLAQSDDAIKAMGFDPDKVRSSMEGLLGAKERQEAERLVADDLAEVDREMVEAKARLSFSSAATRSGRKRRSMV